MTKRQKEILLTFLEQGNNLAKEIGFTVNPFGEGFEEQMESAPDRDLVELFAVLHAHGQSLLKNGYNMIVIKPELRPFVEAFEANFNLLQSEQNKLAEERNKLVEPLNDKLDKLNEKIKKVGMPSEETIGFLQENHMQLAEAGLRAEYQRTLDEVSSNKEVIAKVDALLKDVDNLGEWYDLEEQFHVNPEKYRFEYPLIYLGTRMDELRQKLEEERKERIAKANQKG